MANPLIPQGTLNRLRASVVWNNFPALNVTAPYLAREGIRISFEGKATTPIVAMTGAVLSPEPFILTRIVLRLLKTQGLSDQYKTQMETSSILGDCTIRPDVSEGLSNFQLTNCSIEDIGDMSFAGDEAFYPTTCFGYYNINSSLWDG